MKLTPRQLKVLYPYQFEGPVIYLAFMSGWIDVFAQLCEDIDKTLGPDKRGFHWTQTKEKFGMARFYFQLGVTGFDDEGNELEDSEEIIELRRKLLALKHQAEVQTSRRCIVCGDPGDFHSDESWRLVLCETHAAQRGAGVILKPWIDDDGEVES